MARLRKPSVAEPTTFMPPPASPMRSTRSSPRKSACEEPTRRGLRYTSSYDPEDSILVPKVQSQETPGRKQRVLRPVASNSRLLRKLSNESLATPDRKNRRVRIGSGSSSLNHLYAKSLAKSVARRPMREMRPIEIAVEQEIIPDENETEADQSIWCGEEGDTPLEDDKEKFLDANEDEEDEDPIVDVKQRRRPLQSQQTESDTEDDDEPVKQPKRLIRWPQKIIEPDTEEDEEDEEDEDEMVRSRQNSTNHIENEMPPPSSRKGLRTISNWAQEVIDLTGSPEPPASFVVSQTTRTRTSSFAASSRPVSSASNDIAAVMHYSPTPTKHRSPRKAPPISRPATPPLPPPSPSKLVSPSKKKSRTPKAAELRPSLDAFWNPEVVNDWNDRHSPSKPLISPRKQKWREDIEKQMNSITITDDESDLSSQSPTASSRKPKVSPAKKTSSAPSTQIRTQRKDFAARKHEIAEAFLVELDKTIADGRIGTLSSETGGIKLVWSKTLKTTAGRANWRREQIRTRTGPLPSDLRTEVRHHCSIELAEKVIDDEERLYNVLAHEFCHLTTFMLSEVRNNPHGAEFKSWGRKVTSAFAHKCVEVTTKHSYKIDYKYVWECISCGYEFKRHSKSVDPIKHSCGRCKGKLVQTKPTPRGGVKIGNDGKKERSEYQIFVKDNFARVKKDLEAKGQDCQMGKVMEAVAREYREMKGKDKTGEKTKGVDELEGALEGLKL